MADPARKLSDPTPLGLISLVEVEAHPNAKVTRVELSQGRLSRPPEFILTSPILNSVAERYRLPSTVSVILFGA